MTNEATYFIASGAGNGMFTLRKNDGFDQYGELKSYHVRNLCRDPKEAYQKAREYVISQNLDPDAMDQDYSPAMRVLEDSIPNTELNTWGECNPEYQNQMSYVKAGVMPWGKYYDEKIDTIPISYFVYMFQSDLEKFCFCACFVDFVGLVCVFLCPEKVSLQCIEKGVGKSLLFKVKKFLLYT